MRFNFLDDLVYVCLSAFTATDVPRAQSQSEELKLQALVPG